MDRFVLHFSMHMFEKKRKLTIEFRSGCFGIYRAKPDIFQRFQHWRRHKPACCQLFPNYGRGSRMLQHWPAQVRYQRYQGWSECDHWSCIWRRWWDSLPGMHAVIFSSSIIAAADGSSLQLIVCGFDIVEQRIYPIYSHFCLQNECHQFRNISQQHREQQLSLFNRLRDRPCELSDWSCYARCIDGIRSSGWVSRYCLGCIGSLRCSFSFFCWCVEAALVLIR